MSNNFDLNQTPDFGAELAMASENYQKQEEQSKTFDDRFIRMKPGHNYRVRLCWPADPTGKRHFPFIFRNIHGDKREGQPYSEITCPTSDYIAGKAGFRMCKCCDEISRLWKDWSENHNQTSKDLYDHFKRKYRNTALVYVVSDGSNPENNGKFMLMMIPTGMGSNNVANYLRRKVLNIPGKNEAPLPADQVIGKDAFYPDNGYDLNVAVKQETTPYGTFNSYAAEFLPKPTRIPVTQADINKAGIDLKFDEDFYKMSDQEEIAKWTQEHVLGMKMDIEINGNKTFDPTAPMVGDPLGGFDPNANSAPVAPQSQQTVAQKPAAAVAPKATTASPSPAVADINASQVDDILNGLESGNI